jgi:PAS domain-containing protein
MLIVSASSKQGSKQGSKQSSQQASRGHSEPGSPRMGRNKNQSSRGASVHSDDVNVFNAAVDDLEQLNSNRGMSREQELFNKQVTECTEHLLELENKQKEAMTSLLQRQKDEFEVREREAVEGLRELDATQETEMMALKKKQEQEITEIATNQARELTMQNMIYETELKAILERKMLNALLDTVVDAIISIDTRGIILRFNNSAEKIFGYKSEEVLGLSSMQLILG